MYNYDEITKLSDIAEGKRSEFLQDTAEKFVLPAFYTCQTHLVEHLVRESVDSESYFSAEDLDELLTPYHDFDGDVYTQEELQEKKEELEELLETAESVLEDLESSQEEFQDRLSNLNDEREDALNRLGEVEDGLAKGDCQDLSAERRAINAEVSSLRTQIEGCELSTRNCENDINGQKVRVQHLEARIEEADEALGDSKLPEVFEWWLVSDRLAGELEQVGCLVISDGMSQWYGRQACGQALSMDYNIQSIGLDWAGVERDV